ncbi:MAG: phosphonate metabolism protein/1,5-bisphosphokinase (PRPP-forming) PhnN [Desulfocurvibacter africanus]
MSRIVYLMGASGSGKDSILGYARERAGGLRVLFAHRYITRPAEAGGENHVALSAEEFAFRKACGFFALSWRSNGLDYGLGLELDHWLEAGLLVVLNGSREHLPQALGKYPSLVPVLVRADAGRIRERLDNRGREGQAEVEARMAKAKRLDHGVIGATQEGLHVIDNNGTLEIAGEALLTLLRKLAPGQFPATAAQEMV